MLLAALRVLTFFAYVILAGLLVRWVRVGLAGGGSRAADRVWRWFAVLYGAIASNYGILELWQILKRSAAEDAWIVVIDQPLYSIVYLLQAGLGAAIPATLIALLPGDTRWRRLSRAVLGVVAVILVAAITAGALLDWSTLLSWTRLTSFISIGLHLLFWSLFAVGSMPRDVGLHLALFVALESVFTTLVPVQEVFFQAAGWEAADRIWHVNQLLQALTAGGQAAIVFSLLRSRRTAAGESIGTFTDEVGSATRSGG